MKAMIDGFMMIPRHVMISPRQQRKIELRRIPLGNAMALDILPIAKLFFVISGLLRALKLLQVFCRRVTTVRVSHMWWRGVLGLRHK
jgi:hypothetical protein